MLTAWLTRHARIARAKRRADSPPVAGIPQPRPSSLRVKTCSPAGRTLLMCWNVETPRDDPHKRHWHYRGGQHPRDGIYDRITWNFVRYIWDYRKIMRPRVCHLLAEHAGHAQLITLTSRRDAARFLAGAET
jgi:hypothetical protein